MVYPEVCFEGEYVESNEMFLTEDKIPFSQWIVHEWEPINNDKNESKTETKKESQA
jgi:hypothetical protein